MRLFLNDKEAEVVKTALYRLYIDTQDDDFETDEIIHRIEERMELCDKLQGNMRRSKGHAK